MPRHLPDGAGRIVAGDEVFAIDREDPPVADGGDFAPAAAFDEFIGGGEAVDDKDHFRVAVDDRFGGDGAGALQGGDDVFAAGETEEVTGVGFVAGAPAGGVEFEIDAGAACGGVLLQLADEAAEPGGDFRRFFRTSDPFPERLDHIGIVVAAQRRHDEGGDVHAAEEGLQAVLVIPDDGEIDFEQQDPFGGEGAAAADFCGVFGAGDDFAVAVDGGEFTGGAEFDEERGSGGGGGEDPPGRRSGFRCGGEGERGEERQQEPCPPERMKEVNPSHGKERIPIEVDLFRSDSASLLPEAATGKLYLGSGDFSSIPGVISRNRGRFFVQKLFSARFPRMTAVQTGEGDLIFAEQSGQETDGAEQCSADDGIGEIDSAFVCAELSGAASGAFDDLWRRPGSCVIGFFPEE